MLKKTDWELNFNEAWLNAEITRNAAAGKEKLQEVESYLSKLKQKKFQCQVLAWSVK